VRTLFAYDLVGFQTENDLQAFRDYVEREAGGWTDDGGTMHAYGTSVRAASFPISIDTRLVAARAARAASTRRAERLHDSLAGRRLVIGVDRLDYTKGLVHRFDAVERLLEGNPEYRSTVVVLQIAPPSREDVSEYQRIRAELDARIGRINGRFGEPDHLPLRYVNRSFRQETLFGFYRASRVGLVTPLRDGMNLVAKEFVASQDPNDPGVLVLSRFAGAARELETALIVNPFDVDQIADALDRGLAMPVEERRARHAAMMTHLNEHDVHAWRDAFLEALQHPDKVADRLGCAMAVVSGRPLDELTRMLAPFAGIIAGQHGLEHRRADGTVIRHGARPELDGLRPLLAGFAARHEGVLFEDKGAGLALHYRQAPLLGVRCRALVRQAATTSNGALAAVAGKMVIELTPRANGKGRAIADFLAEAPFRGRRPVFVGDDTTDEDGFAVVNRLGGVSVHVGGGATIARHNLATVGDVLAWLARGLAE